MRVTVVLHNVGLVLRAFSVVFLIPAAVDLGHGNRFGALGFLITAVAAAVLGEIARRLHLERTELKRLEGIAVVASVWMVLAWFGAIPYLFHRLTLVDALFESMSGLTTTGATIFTDFSLYGEGLYLWRSMSQWFGGMGVIALFIAVLPKLAIAGRQLFFAEAPGPDEDKLTPRVRHTAIALWALYVGLTAAQVLLLSLTGMPLFDAVCNSFTTLAAGGFSPHPQSIGGYANPAAEWVFVLFIFLAGANYTLQYRALRGNPASLFRDEEFRTYSAIVVVASLVLFAFLWDFSRAPSAEYLQGDTSLGALIDAGPLDLLRQAMFQVLTIITTAGFATDDFNLWSDPARSVLLILMFIGGSAGSAAGGPKVVRVLLIFKYATGELVRALHPRAVHPVRLNGTVVPRRILRAIVAFLLLYLLIYAISVVLVVAGGADLITAITASIATLGNIGPGFGAVGPMGSYAHFPSFIKIVLFFDMWIGRLEVMTVLVLLQPGVWRVARWSD